MPQQIYDEEDPADDNSGEPEFDEPGRDNDTDACRNCNRAISILSDRCPYCGAWVTDEAPRRRPWFLVLAIILIASILGVWRFLW